MRYRGSLLSLTKSWSQMKNILERSRRTQYELSWDIAVRQLSISLSRKSTFPVISDSDSNANLENLSFSKHLFDRYQQCVAIAHAGGGEKAINRHVVKQKKLLVRDRLALFLDDPNDFLELSVMGGLAMEYGNVPKAGMIAGIGRVQGKLCMIVANDATVKGGTVYPVTLKKQLRAQEIAEQNRLPTVYIVESGGGFLPLQADIFNPGGKTFCNEAVMSSMGIPQMAIVCGNCTAGGAYIPTMADQTAIVHRKGYIFLGGPPLVQAATGEIVTTEELGGATLHCSVSGCTDYFAENEEEALSTGRDMVATLNLEDKLPVHQDWEEPLYSSDHLRALVAKDNVINIYKVIARLVDGSRFHEFKKQFGPTMVTGFAHIKG
ncbi:methylcrotonoyl-CoA carboxylase beta chain, mitochondrial-like isoform X1 [Mizuhopecten yessoensis]|nr:methylcrotonoyl-CoA carboxylase beta chain, mitochondrial-like isoform X1 [Mizuhopecten yessoensis]